MGMEVAETILAQLGGRHFLVMTGAKDLVGGDNRLTMRLTNASCNGRKCTNVRITLDMTDTYTVEALTVRKFNLTLLDTVSGVYCENLQAVFTSLTGLHTQL